VGARRTLNTRYWRPTEGHHAFGILQNGQTNDNLTVWPATALAFRQLDGRNARATLRKLATDSISADWGAHPLSTGSPLYEPMHYNNGAVWPFVTGFVALAQYRYGRPFAGWPLIDALAQMTFDWSLGRHPELLSGSYYRPLDTAVPQQFFATSMLVSPIVSGLLGWMPNAPARRARLAPDLPPQWDHVAVRNLRVGRAAVDVTISRDSNRITLDLAARGDSVTIDLELDLPLGSAPSMPGRGGLVVEGPTDSAEAILSFEGEIRNQERASIPLGATPRRAVLTWTGGLEVEPPHVALVPGQASAGLRVVAFSWRRGGWDLQVEGARGRSYELRLHGTPVRRAENATVMDQAGRVTTIRVEFPAGSGRATSTVRLTP
jgi:hypothetical protein